MFVSISTHDVSPKERDRRERWVLLLLLGLLGLARAFYTSGVGGYGPDGGLYFEVARHVRDGDGLVSHLSLYHAGFKAFPQPTPLYPVWPLVLGLLARILPLEWLAHWLPTGLHGLSVLLAFHVVKGLERRFGWETLAWVGGIPLTSALVSACALGFNLRYFQATARPYSEALSYCLVLLALPRLLHFWDRPGMLRGIEAGAWAGLLLLCRSQLLLVTLALGATMPLGVIRSGARMVPAGVGLALGWILTLLPQQLWLASQGVTPSLLHVLRFDLYRDLDVLSPLPLLVQTDGLKGWLLDRGRGITVAFNPLHDEGFRKGVGLYFLALPLAGLVLLGHAVKQIRSPNLRESLDITRMTRLLREGMSLPAWFGILLLLSGWLSLHTLHKAMFSEWNFSTRHALTALPVCVASLCWSFGQGRWVRKLAGILLVASVWHAASSVWNTTTRQLDQPERALQVRAQGLAAYLLTLRPDDPDLRVAMVEPQKVAPLAPGVGFHWLGPSTQDSDLIALFEVLETDLLALEAGGPRMPFVSTPGLLADYCDPVPEAPLGWRLFRCGPGAR